VRELGAASFAYMARIAPNNPFAFPPFMEVSVGSTIPRMESVESSREQRPRVTHNTMDGV
jgi:hypothetical protein